MRAHLAVMLPTDTSQAQHCPFAPPANCACTHVPLYQLDLSAAQASQSDSAWSLFLGLIGLNGGGTNWSSFPESDGGMLCSNRIQALWSLAIALS